MNIPSFKLNQILEQDLVDLKACISCLDDLINQKAQYSISDPVVNQLLRIRNSINTVGAYTDFIVGQLSNKNIDVNDDTDMLFD